MRSLGVGITGRGSADVGSGKKGLPFLLMPVLAVAALFLVGLTITKGSHYVTGMFSGKKVVAKTSPAAAEKQKHDVSLSRPGRLAVEPRLMNSSHSASGLFLERDHFSPSWSNCLTNVHSTSIYESHRQSYQSQERQVCRAG